MHQARAGEYEYDEIYRPFHTANQNIVQLATIHLALHARQHVHHGLIAPYPFNHFSRGLQLADITPHAAIRNSQIGPLLLQLAQHLDRRHARKRLQCPYDGVLIAIQLLLPDCIFSHRSLDFLFFHVDIFPHGIS